ncbi:MAG TPA: hypothetical protein PK771_15930, partial [Spirochaetota bacterium]|nr:hypothetical protein [Spirochaetota bacterium]
VILIPFLLSIVVKRLDFIKQKFKLVSKNIYFLFVFVVYIAISSASNNFKEKSVFELMTIFFITAIVAIVYFISGYFFSKDTEIRKSLMSTMGQKNTGLCIWVAISNFNPSTAIPAAMYIIIHHVINSFIIYRFSKGKISVNQKESQNG